MTDLLLTGNHDSAAKDCQAHKESLERLKRLHSDERKALNSALSLLQDQFKEVKVQKELEESKKIDMNEQNKNLRVTLDKLRLQVRKKIKCDVTIGFNLLLLIDRQYGQEQRAGGGLLRHLDAVSEDSDQEPAEGPGRHSEAAAEEE